MALLSQRLSRYWLDLRVLGHHLVARVIVGLGFMWTVLRGKALFAFSFQCVWHFMAGLLMCAVRRLSILLVKYCAGLI